MKAGRHSVANPWFAAFCWAMHQAQNQLSKYSFSLSTLVGICAVVLRIRFVVDLIGLRRTAEWRHLFMDSVTSLRIERIFLTAVVSSITRCDRLLAIGSAVLVMSYWSLEQPGTSYNHWLSLSNSSRTATASKEPADTFISRILRDDLQVVFWKLTFYQLNIYKTSPVMSMYNLNLTTYK